MTSTNSTELKPDALVWFPSLRALVQLLVGFVIVSLGVALVLESRLGLAPWGVMHEGLSQQLGLSFGRVVQLLGLVVLLLWIPLKQKFSIGTPLNVLLIGPTMDLWIALLPTPDHLAARVLFLVVGVVIFGLGGGIYIGAGLGPGPRDGLMTGLARKGLPIARVRTGLELAALTGGWLLGGTVGVGTVLFALSVGPIVARVLRYSQLDPARRRWGGTRTATDMAG